MSSFPVPTESSRARVIVPFSLPLASRPLLHPHLSPPTRFSLHPATTPSSFCTIILCPPQLHFTTCKTNKILKNHSWSSFTHQPARFPASLLLPHSSLSNNFFPCPPLHHPELVLRATECGCAVWENKAKKLQSDVIKCSSLARGTLHKETFLRGCFF